MPISDPTSISNCIVWLDANDISTLYSDIAATIPILGNTNEAIRCWKDKTTNKLFINTDSTGINSPKYSPSFFSKPSINFTNTNNQDTGFTSNFLQAYNSCMVFAVIYADSSSDRVIYSHSHNTASNITNSDIWTPLRQNSSFIRNFYAGSWGQFLTLPLSSLCVLNSYMDNNIVDGFGVGVGLNGNYSQSTQTNILLQNSKPMSVHSIGKSCLSKSSNENFIGYISEILVYDRMLIPEEIQQLENYLCQKWLGRNSDTIVAKSNGDWFTPTTWLGNTLPEPHQIVYSSNKKITINDNINVKQIVNSKLPPKSYNSNGQFILSDNFNLKTNVQNSTDHFSETCLQISTPSGVVNLSGNIIGIANATVQSSSYKRYGACVEHIGNCNLNVYGDVASGQNTHYGIYHDSFGSLTIFGNIYSLFGNSVGVYLPSKNNIGKLIVYGDVVGSGSDAISNNSSNASIDIYGNITSTYNRWGLITTSSGVHTIYGDVSASSGHVDGGGIYINGPSTFHIYGNIYADNKDSTSHWDVGSISIYNNNYLSNLYIYNNIYNKGSRVSFLSSSRFEISQAVVSVKQLFAVPGNQTIYRKTTADPLFFYGVGNYTLSFQPSLSDTVIGQPYGHGKFESGGKIIPSLYGQMKIPPREVVKVNETIGTERGIAIFNKNDLQYVWDCKFEDIAINNNTIGDYLINIPSIEKTGKVILENDI